MNTVCLLGSPRRGGNSDVLAARFIEKAKLLNAPINSYALSDLNYNGCINLFQCKSGLTRCAQSDDLTEVLQAIAEAEVLVLASPVYFTGLSGQMKLAIDRFFSFFVPNYPTAAIKSRLDRAKHLVLLQTQGEPEERYRDLLESYSASFTGLGFEHLHLVRAWGVRESGEVLRHEQFLLQCDNVVRGVYGRESA